MGVQILAAATAASLPPLWRVLSELAYFLSLAGAIGFTLTYLVVVRPTLQWADTAEDDRSVVRRRTTLLLAWTGVVLLVAGYFQLAARVARAGKGMPYADAMAPGRIWTFLRAPGKAGEWTTSGTLILVQNVLMIVVAVLLIALFTTRGATRLDAIARWVAPLAILSTLVPATPTNLKSETLDAALNGLLDQVHILGATTWLGGVAVLGALATTRRSLSGGAGELWARLWQRFSGLALVAVGSILSSGLWLAWKHVGAPSQLLTTTYGRFLLVKLTIVLAVIVAGGVNQLWLIPRIVRARASGSTESLLKLTVHHFPKVIAIEVFLGVAVLTIVPFLSGSARSQAGDTSGSPVASGSILAIGALMVLTLVCSFLATAKASNLAGLRTASVEP